MATNTGSGSRNLVFISYRRDTGLETARNICDRLSMSGIPTFFDFDSMRNGKFNDQIFEAIENASDFVLVVSRNALDRCRNTDDWVRIEIEHALKHNKNIVLVYTEPQLTFPDNFPPSLWDLKNYQGLHLSHEYYNESITKLMKMLNARPGRKSYRTAIYGAMIAVVAAGAGMWAFMDRDDRAEMLSPEAEVQIPVASAPAPAVVENVADTRTDAAAPAPDKSVSDTRERPSVRTTPDNTAMASVASTTPAVMQPTVAEVKKETPTAVKTKSRIEELQDAYASGNPEAAYYLGMAYLNGDGVSKSAKTAFKYFKESAEAGDPDGMYRLGWCYRMGRGTDKNIKTAEKWWDKAAALGHTKAAKEVKSIKSLM